MFRQTNARKPSFHSHLSCVSFSGLALPATLPSINQENLAGLEAKRRKIAKQTHRFSLLYWLLTKKTLVFLKSNFLPKSKAFLNNNSFICWLG